MKILARTYRHAGDYSHEGREVATGYNLRNDDSIEHFTDI